MEGDTPAQFPGRLPFVHSGMNFKLQAFSTRKLIVLMNFDFAGDSGLEFLKAKLGA